MISQGDDRDAVLEELGRTRSEGGTVQGLLCGAPRDKETAGHPHATFSSPKSSLSKGTEGPGLPATAGLCEVRQCGRMTEPEDVRAGTG